MFMVTAINRFIHLLHANSCLLSLKIGNAYVALTYFAVPVFILFLFFHRVRFINRLKIMPHIFKK